MRKAPERITASVDIEAVGKAFVKMGFVTVGTEGVPEPFEPAIYTRADITAAQVAAAYERAADLCVDQFQAHLDLVITGNPDNARNRESAANMAEKLSHEIRALATDTQTDALDAVKRDAERAERDRIRDAVDDLTPTKTSTAYQDGFAAACIQIRSQITLTELENTDE